MFLHKGLTLAKSFYFTFITAHWVSKLRNLRYFLEALIKKFSILKNFKKSIYEQPGIENLMTSSKIMTLLISFFIQLFSNLLDYKAGFPLSPHGLSGRTFDSLTYFILLFLIWRFRPRRHALKVEKIQLSIRAKRFSKKNDVKVVILVIRIEDF